MPGPVSRHANGPQEFVGTYKTITRGHKNKNDPSTTTLNYDGGQAFIFGFDDILRRELPV